MILYLEEKIYTLQASNNEDKTHELIKPKKRLGSIELSRRFKLTPKTFYCTFFYEDLQKNCIIPKRLKTRARVVMDQLPVNLSDATTGHKLQGCSKDEIIIQSVCYKTSGHVYTSLSRVRKLKGLFLSKKLDYRKFKKCYDKTSSYLKAFDERMKEKMPKPKQRNT